MPAHGITRGELARRTGVNAETIRYFERIGLIAAAERTQGGRRIYGDEHVRTLAFIRSARGLGFTPDEVRAIVELGGPDAAPCNEVKQIAERHLRQVRSKIADLREIERLLARAVAQCPGGCEPDCSVIDMIDERA